MNTNSNTQEKQSIENLNLLLDAVRKLCLAKWLNENNWSAVRKNLGQHPVIIKVPKMVDGQGSPNVSLAHAEQPIMASAISDDFTILQVLRHYGITPQSVTLWETVVPLHQYIGDGIGADGDIHDILTSTVAKGLSVRESVEEIAKEVNYRGELRWGEYPL